MKTRHVPHWIRQMPRGWLRAYLTGLFLPMSRGQRRWMGEI